MIFIVSKIKNYVFPIIVIFICFLLSILKINGSSVGIYEKYFYGSQIKKNYIIGEPRLIRGDEWLVVTNWTLSQTKNKFSSFNPNIGDGQNMNFVNVPTKSWYMFFKPSNLFFLVSKDIDFAFSAKWWFPTIIFIVGSYLFFLFFSKNYYLSSLISISLYFSPFIQWWYSSGYLEMIGYSFLTITIFILFIRSKSRIKSLIFIILFSYLILCLVFILYPPGLIIIFIVFLTFLISYLAFNRYNFIFSKHDYIYKVCLLIMAVFVVFFVLSRFFQYNKYDIYTVMNTSYPGKRVVSGGGFSAYRFISSYYDVQLLDDSKTVPSIISHNQSEASGCLFFSLIIIPLILVDSLVKFRKKKKINKTLLYLSTLMIILMFWMVMGFGYVGTKLFPLNMVPSNRAMLGVFLLNFLLIFLYLIDKNEYVKYDKLKLVLIITNILLVLFFGFYLKYFYPNYIQNVLKIIIIAFVCGLLSISLLYKKKLIFLIILSIFSMVSTYRVNPLRFSNFLDVDKMDLFFIDLNQNINKNKSKWVVYDDFVLANKLISNGLNVLNGTHYYPQLNIWNDISIKKEDIFVYNRYAHVLFTSKKNYSVFNLLNTDTFEVSMSPCDVFFKNNNVQYFVFRERKEYSCLRQIGISPVEFYYVYEIIP